MKREFILHRHKSSPSTRICIVGQLPKTHPYVAIYEGELGENFFGSIDDEELVLFARNILAVHKRKAPHN